MTIPVSTVDTVKDYLVAQITAAINDPEVNVSYDVPGAWQPDDIIVVGDIQVTNSIESFVGSGGAHWLFEAYEVDITISVFREGDLASTAWKRAKALSDLIDVAVRTDPTLGTGGTGIPSVQRAYPSTTRYQSEWAEDHSGRVVTVQKTIQVEASI